MRFTDVDEDVFGLEGSGADFGQAMRDHIGAIADRLTRGPSWHRVMTDVAVEAAPTGNSDGRRWGGSHGRRHLGGRLPGSGGNWFPIEVELSHKSRGRLNAVLKLHADLIRSGRSPFVIYICSTPRLADLVLEARRRAGLTP